jgi:hypothetical protein
MAKAKLPAARRGRQFASKSGISKGMKVKAIAGRLQKRLRGRANSPAGTNPAEFSSVRRRDAYPNSHRQESIMADPQDRPVNDRREGIMRDPVNWNGEIVSYVKDIGNGDPGYDANIRQVLIMTQDGTEKVVPETEILRNKRVMAEQTRPSPTAGRTRPCPRPSPVRMKAAPTATRRHAPCRRRAASRTAPQPAPATTRTDGGL